MREPCATIAEALASIDGPLELEAFAEALRNPPAGFPAKPVTPAEWNLIAMRKIEMQRKPK